MSRLSRNSGASTSWNPKGLSRPVAGKLYLYFLLVGGTRHVLHSAPRWVIQLEKHVFNIVQCILYIVPLSRYVSLRDKILAQTPKGLKTRGRTTHPRREVRPAEERDGERYWLKFCDDAEHTRSHTGGVDKVQSHAEPRHYFGVSYQRRSPLALPPSWTALTYKLPSKYHHPRSSCRRATKFLNFHDLYAY